MGSKVLMACGHAANAEQLDLFGEPRPVCAICCGIKPGWDEVAPVPVLKDRVAKCSCGLTRPSSTKLAFFEHRPELSSDSFYCGCRGWD